MSRPLVAGLCLATACSSLGAASDRKPEESAWPAVAQPGIPGPWEMRTAQPLPALADIVAQPGPGRLIYGLYVWAGEYHAHRASIRAVGWPSLRVAGPFDDRLMKALVEDQARVMVTLENRLLDAEQGKDRSAFVTDDEFLAACREQMLQFLNRYGPGGSFFVDHAELPVRPIHEVEIWNEPNFQYLIPPDGRPQEDLEAAREDLYIRLLQTVYPALKQAHPEVAIVGMAGGGMSAGDLRFVEHVHARSPGLAEMYDIFSTHPYVRPAPPEANLVESWGSYSIARSIAHHRAVLASHGPASKPVWITEIGWPIAQSDGGRYATPAHVPLVTPLLQAAYACRTYALALRLGVARVHMMFSTDTDNFNGGFFLRDGTWRPSARAVQTMIRMLPDPRLTGALHDGEAGLHVYTFAPGAANASEVLMAWNVAGPRAWSWPTTTRRVRVTDMLGHETEQAAVNGRITLTVGPCPVWIQPIDGE